MKVLLPFVRRSATASLLIVLASGAYAAPHRGDTKPTLAVGSPAPQIKVGAWVQGKGISAFKPGKVYVMEFWATWCGPCFKAMPHLSELSEKFRGKVEFAGVSVWEDRDASYTAPTKVARFMAQNPKRMTYNVGYDAKDGFMAKNWLTAAGRNSIPTTMVIDQAGKIAFIGHPMDLELVIQPVLDKKFDAAAFAARPQMPDMAPIQAAAMAKDLAKVRSEADRISTGWPAFKDMAAGYRMIALHLESPEKASAAMAKLIAEKKFDEVSNVGMSFLGMPWLTKDETQEVIGWVESVPEGQEMRFIVDMLLTNAYEKVGDRPKALAAAKRNLAAAEKMGVDESALKNLRDRVKTLEGSN